MKKLKKQQLQNQALKASDLKKIKGGNNGGSQSNRANIN